VVAFLRLTRDCDCGDLSVSIDLKQTVARALMKVTTAK
jgi:hypothetical protein